MEDHHRHRAARLTAVHPHAAVVVAGRLEQAVSLHASGEAVVVEVHGVDDCAVTAERTILCWDATDPAQAGPSADADATVDALSPVAISGPVAAAMDAGANHTYAVGSEGQVWCRGAMAALGAEAATTPYIPIPLTGLEATCAPSRAAARASAGSSSPP